MKILVTGQYRSGSTWLFNAVRLVVNSGTGVKHESVFYQSGTSYDYENAIVKTHAFYPAIIKDFDFIITSTRNKDDVFNSMKALSERGIEPDFHNASNFSGLSQFIHWNDEWMKVSNYVMDYDLMMSYKGEIIESIKKTLGLECDTDSILNELSKIKAPRTGFDPITFMTSTHHKFF